MIICWVRIIGIRYNAFCNFKDDHKQKGQVEDPAEVMTLLKKKKHNWLSNALGKKTTSSNEYTENLYIIRVKYKKEENGR